jgi:hypothetical protein
LPRSRNIFDVDISICFDPLNVSRAKTPLVSHLDSGDGAALGPKPDGSDSDLQTACHLVRAQEDIVVFVHFGLEILTVPGRNGCFYREPLPP